MKKFYIILTLEYGSKSPAEMRSELMPREKAEEHYENLCLSLHYDRSDTFHGVALMEEGNPIAIKINIL